MSVSDRQNRLLINQDWKRIYQSFRNADFQSYDFENLRRTMIQYLKENYPEDFNDYIETSEYIALIDLIAFLGQNLSFRVDLNSRENFLETAERRESILKLARLVSYNPKRNQAANGLLKLESVKTTESILDSSGLNLSGTTISWNDPSNAQWFEQFIKILNNTLPVSNPIGQPIRSADIDGVPTEQYKINSLNTGLPVYTFSKNVQGESTKFEIVSTAISGSSIIEEPPLPANNPSFVYRDDGQGAGSSNTGFFMHFRQGKLERGEFKVDSPTPNQIVGIDATNINNSDVWLYGLDLNGFENELWTKVDAVEGNNVIYNSLLKNVRNVYAVSSRIEDRINLVFADGVFGNTPSGNYRVYYRTSANRFLNITPQGMNNINISVPYVSRSGTSEKLTLTFSLKSSVGNSTPAESNASIKQNAPATYYTQNRMVTAEDYNIGPLGVSQDILKVKSVNRISSGISRYFDLKDVTGKYSNTNLYANDGLLYREEFLDKSKFNFTTQTDIEGAVYNTILPIIRNQNIKNFYYKNYPKISAIDLNATWYQQTKGTNENTGYFTDIDNSKYQVGVYTANNLRFLKKGTMIKFNAPEGFHFMDNNNLMPGAADHIGSKTYIWTSIISVDRDGTDASRSLGPIFLNDNVPDGCILSEVRPTISNTLEDDLISQIIDQAFAYNDFALRFDQEEGAWKIILAENINTINIFNLGKAGNINAQNLDSSWLLYFKTNGENYEITYRNLRYIFESESEIKFYYDSGDKIYDSKTGQLLKDKLDILSINTKPDSLQPFTRDFTWYITDAFRDKNGYIDTKKIQLDFFDSDDDGIVDDIDLFDQIIDPEINPLTKIIFQEKLVSKEGIETYKYFSNSKNTILSVQEESSVGSWSQYLDGQVFYISELDVFKKIDKVENSFLTISNYKAFTGRDNFKFYYVHVADSNQRIDPSVSNIIDVYALTRNYDSQTRFWLSGDLAAKPLPPSSDSLFRSYGQEIEKIKSISDEVVYHPVKYKVLFGEKAMSDLQVSFKITKNPDLVLNNNELKSDVIENINRFFSPDNWDFGDTFYFQELSTFIMQNMSPNLASIVIVPKQVDQVFGSLFEIKSEPDEIFISGATVSDIEIIDELTSVKLQTGGKVISSVANTNSGIQSSNTNTTSSNSTSSSSSTSSSTSISSSSSTPSSSGSSSGGYSY